MINWYHQMLITFPDCQYFLFPTLTYPLLSHPQSQTWSSASSTPALVSINEKSKTAMVSNSTFSLFSGPIERPLGYMGYMVSTVFRKIAVFFLFRKNEIHLWTEYCPNLLMSRIRTNKLLRGEKLHNISL